MNPLNAQAPQATFAKEPQPMKRPLILIVSLFALTITLTAQTSREDDNFATIVFLRSGVRGTPNTAIICSVDDSTATPIGGLASNGKLETKFPPGHHRFLVMRIAKHLLTRSESADCYFEADLKAGRTYFVSVRLELLNVGNYLAGPWLLGGPYFTTHPIKKDGQNEKYRLDSPSLFEQAAARPALQGDDFESVEVRKGIQKSLPRIKELYDRYREKHGDDYYLADCDSVASNVPLSSTLLDKNAENFGNADQIELKNRVDTIGIPDGLRLELAKKAALLAGRHRGYQVVATSEKRLSLHLDHRGKVVDYTLVFDTTQIDLYLDARKNNDPEDAPEVDGWTNNLISSIKVYLNRELDRIQIFEEKTGFDPEGFAAMDLAAPVATIDAPPGFTAGEMQEMIVRGANAKGYSVVARDSGLVAVRLKDGKTIANYVFHYANGEAKLYSRVHKERTPETLFRNKRWEANIVASIQHFISLRTIE